MGFAIVGLVALLVAVPGNAIVAATLWSIAIMAWRWAVAVQRGIEVRWEGPARVQPDTPGTGMLIVRNRSRWPVPWLEVNLRLPAGATEPHAFSFVTRLGGRRERRLEVAFTAGDRGVHAPRELTWSAPDLLGMSAPSGDGMWTGPTVIVPRLSAVRRMAPPARSPLAELPLARSLFADQAAVVGVRAYEHGDPLSSIHWQATARTGVLMRKEHERAAARELLVCLDLTRKAYQRRGRPQAGEVAIGAAASLLADTIIAVRQQAGLALSQPAAEGAAPVVLPVRGGDRHLHAMLDTLAAVQLHDGVAIAAVMQHVVPELHAGTTVLIVTGVIGADVATAVTTAHQRGLAVIVVSVGSGVEWQTRLRSHVAGAPCVPLAADRPLGRLPL